jgi:hypothetical protein
MSNEKQDLQQSEISIQQQIRTQLIPGLIAQAETLLKNARTTKDIVDLGKMLITLGGLDRKDTNVNLGNIVTFNMKEGSLKEALGMVSKLAGIQPKDLEDIVQDADIIEETKKPLKQKKSPTYDGGDDYDFLED